MYLRLLLAFSLTFTPAHAGALKCVREIAENGAVSVLQFLAPEKRAFDRLLYREALEDWKSFLAYADPSEVALDRSAWEVPEAVLAFGDAINPTGNTYLSEIEAIESQGGRIRFRNYRLGRHLEFERLRPHVAPKEPSAKVRRTRLPRSFPNWSRQKRLTLTSAAVAPGDPKDLLKILLHYSQHLGFFRLYLAAGHSPLFSGRGTFTEQGLGHAEAFCNQFYSTLNALEKIFPGIDAELPKTDAFWKPGKWGWKRFVQQDLFNIPRVIWPFYQAFSYLEPNQEDYQAWKAGKLREVLASKFENRLLNQWSLDKYRAWLFAYGLVVGSLATFTTYGNLHDFALAGIEDIRFEIKRIVNRTVEERNEALEEYEKSENAIVNSHYDAEIRRLEKKIRKEGDPDGSLQKQLDQARESRGLLHN